MSKVLGIDYGENKIGLALSDEDKQHAFSYQTLTNFQRSNLWQDLASICQAEGVKKIIVGLPLNQEGKVGEQAERVLQFGRQLEKNIKIPVEFEDERFSSAMAEQLFKEAGKKAKATKSLIDQQSAEIILQSYLDKRR